MIIDHFNIFLMFFFVILIFIFKIRIIKYFNLLIRSKLLNYHFNYKFLYIYIKHLLNFYINNLKLFVIFNLIFSRLIFHSLYLDVSLFLM